jgi:hypothetical protein
MFIYSVATVYSTGPQTCTSTNTTFCGLGECYSGDASTPCTTTTTPSTCSCVPAGRRRSTQARAYGCRLSDWSRLQFGLGRWWQFVQHMRRRRVGVSRQVLLYNIGINNEAVIRMKFCYINNGIINRIQTLSNS